MNDDDNEKSANIGILIAAVIGVVVIWGINLKYGLSLSDEGRGLFGDMFGAANALFAGLAFAGVVYAIFMQRLEVKLTKEELRRTKEIFEKQAASLELQNRETKKQIFENTFFQLLRVFSDLTENLDLVDGARTTRGKDVLTAFENRLNRINRSIEKEGDKPDFKEVYRRLYAGAHNDLGHYFRMLYTVIRCVDESEVGNKKFYTNILRAQLSDAELHLILYNGLSEHGIERLKPLLEKYEFFDNLPFTRVMYQDALKLYNEEAFGQNANIRNFLLAEIGF
jgi:hypothetical protein